MGVVLLNVADPSGEELLVVVSVVDVAGRCGFVESGISVFVRDRQCRKADFSLWKIEFVVMRTGRAAVGKGFGLAVVRSVCGVWDSDGTESCFSVLSADDAAVFYSVLMLLHPLLSFENLIGVFINFQF